MAAFEEYYIPGDVIHYEEPFAHILYRDYQGRLCDHCFSWKQNLKRCAACRFVTYCDKKCQKQAWLDHKQECKFLHRLSEERDNFIRLLGKVIFKLKDKDWKMISKKIGNVTMSFDNLMSHSEDRKEDPMSALHSAEVIYLLEMYIGKENLPEEDKLLEIIGKVKHNRFSIPILPLGNASALYLGSSFIDHSCIPNAVRCFTKTTVQFRAIDKIPKDDISKVTISYVPVLEVIDEVKYTFKSFYNPCYCDDCSLPYGESVLTKIIDKRKAFGVIEKTEEFLNKYETRSQLVKVPFVKWNVDEMLNKQEGVLGNTNLLRLRLLLMRCRLWPEVPCLTELVSGIEHAFGKNSPDLIMPYSLLCEALYKSGDVIEMNLVKEKEKKLMAICQTGDELYGI